jgi:cyclic pyranopterin phosphate synthase
VLATARIAAIMAAKRTHELVPLCHAVALTHLEVIIEIDTPNSAVHVTAVADAYDRTGCEMEAMVAVSTGCLTIYDMLKGIDRDMVIADVKLIEKSGGRSGHYKRAEGR